MAEGKGKRIALFVGIGCIALLGLCCGGMGLALFMKKSSYDTAAKEHAERFLGFMQRREYPAAFGATEYMGGSNLYSIEQFQGCVSATVLGDMTAFSCDDVESDLLFDSDGADVICTVTSASHGESEITVHVNSPDEWPYLGFIWFSPGAFMGDAWHGDSCARWSGRDFFEEPPSGRVRP